MNAIEVAAKLKPNLPAVAGSSPVLGVEGLDSRDAELPRVQLMQEKNKVLKAMRAKKIDAREGQMFVSSNESLPLDKIEFVPAYLTKYFDVYEVKGEEDKWLFRTNKENDPRLVGKRWDTQDTPGGGKLKAEVRKAYGVVALVEGFPTVIKFAKSSLKTGSRLYTQVLKDAKEAGLPLWGKKYELTTKEAQKGKNAYYVYEVEAIGPASEAEQAEAAKVYQGFAGKSEKLTAAAGSEDTEQEFA